MASAQAAVKGLNAFERLAGVSTSHTVSRDLAWSHDTSHSISDKQQLTRKDKAERGGAGSVQVKDIKRTNAAISSDTTLTELAVWFATYTAQSNCSVCRRE
eukprot:m.474325 g.474325  ORF g.474325 m.474325 type:complete len:101 (-) comp36035_c0_seq1:106-408(-)